MGAGEGWSSEYEFNYSEALLLTDSYIFSSTLIDQQCQCKKNSRPLYITLNVDRMNNSACVTERYLQMNDLFHIATIHLCIQSKLYRSGSHALSNHMQLHNNDIVIASYTESNL